MERFLILFIVMFFFAACGTKTVEIGNPDFPDNNAAADDDTVLSDSDSQIDPDSDSNIPDGDSAIDPDGDTTLPDNDSVIDPDDDTVIDHDDDTVIIPDDDAVVTECTVGERKCDDTLDNVLECNVAHKWISVEDCSAPLKMCVESPADNFFCDDLVCEPGVKLCKNEDLYTCNTDGQGDTLAQNCTDTEYCNTVSLTCEDMVCDPSDIYCDGTQLKKCADNGSSFQVLEDCSSVGECSESLEKCVNVGIIGETFTFSANNGRRGNYFNCTKDVKVIEFAQGFDLSANTDLTWAVYEDANGDNTFEKIFSKTETVSPAGASFYSTGAISVDLKSGRKYLFFTAWTGNRTFLYGGSAVDIGFGNSINGYNSSFNGSLEDSLVNPSSINGVYRQQIKFIE